MATPLISIVIVTWNADATLRASIDSVINQNYPKKELVIIDGESTDKTVEIIKSYGDRIGYFISEKDNGIYDAMNKGIAAAKGDWLLFLGADDLLYTDTVLSNVFLKHDLKSIDLVYGPVCFVSNRQLFGSEKNYHTIIERNLCHQGIFYNKDIFQKIGVYNTRYAIVADHDINLRIFQDESLQKKYLTDIITLYNDKGMSNSVIDKHFHGDKLKVFLERDKIPYFSPILQQYHFYYGLICLLNGKIGLALKHIPVSWISGKRKLFYFFFTGKFILRILVRHKIRLK